MTTRVNHETANDPHPVEQDVSIVVGEAVFKFTVIVPRYIASKLTREDWSGAGADLRGERDRHVRDAIFAGTYFTDRGFAAVREKVRQSMCDLIYSKFQTRQIEAGEDAWVVPETLQRATA